MPPGNFLLDAAIAEAGMSRQGLARRIRAAGAGRGLELAYDHTSVGRWLRGQVPRPPVPEIICAILGDHLGRVVSRSELGFPATNSSHPRPDSLRGFVNVTTATWHADDQQRADIRDARPEQGALAFEPVWNWENEPGDGDVANAGLISVGSTDVRRLGDARLHYERMYRRAGGVTMHHRVARFLNQHAAPLLHGQYSDVVGRELHRAIAGLTTIAGISAYDSGFRGLAQNYLHQSLRLARSSGDGLIGCYVLAVLTNQALASGEPREAQALAAVALRSRDLNTSPALVADVRAMQAKAFAAVGDRTSARIAVRHAEAAIADIGSPSEPVETSYVLPGYIEAQMAETFLMLGSLAVADQLSSVAVDARTHPRGRVTRLATSASIALRRGDAERAAILAEAMVDAAHGWESYRLAGRMRRLRAEFEHGRPSITRSVVGRIDEALAVSVD